MFKNIGPYFYQANIDDSIYVTIDNLTKFQQG